MKCKALTLLLISLPTMLWAASGTFDIGSPYRIIPHLTRANGGFITKLLVENPSDVPQTFRFHGFDETGNPLPVLLNLLAPIPPKSVAFLDMNNLFADVSQASHFTYDTRTLSNGIFGMEVEPLEVSVIYEYVNGGQPAQVSAAETKATRWRLFAGNWQAGFDGLAVVNLGNAATDVWVHQYDFEGNLLQSEPLAEGLARFAKALYVLGSTGGSAFTPREDAYYEIEADQNLALTALRGDGAQTLWAVETKAEANRAPEILEFALNGEAYFKGQAIPVTLDYLAGEYAILQIESENTEVEAGQPIACSVQFGIDSFGDPLDINLTFENRGTYHLHITVHGPGGETTQSITIQVQ